MFTKIDAYVILSAENRFYYTGFMSSFGCVIITAKAKYFITDPRYAAEARKSVEGFTILTTNGSAFYDDIVKVLKKEDAKTVGYEDSFVTVAGVKKLKAALSDFTLKAASNVFDDLRLIKSEEEIQKVAAAEIVTQKALLKTLPLLKAGVSEKDISNEITYQMLSLGAEELAFENIVAFGVNTANPHHHPSMKKLEKNEMVTFDIGARVNGYCGDMTRTFCFGKPDEKLDKIHNIVLEAQKYALNNIKAGMSGREAHLLASEYITANGYGNEFTHSLGHGIGIVVHEGPYMAPRSEDILKENMIVSVEPGIYVDGFGGARIEDIVVVKNDGVVNLTTMVDKGISL